ncbi:phytosulfokines-like [Salvia hispanica]|uniref:phytosulfokines-like n=1 Tax=Salvia hispanica TaxID=49212 RepID=UPI002009BC4E|nr:phytosulfokines-like [Salvia hispanica]
MAKIVSLCIITFLLFLTFSGNVLARPEPQFSDIAPVEIHGKGDEVENASGEGEDEWLMRRTLEAHLDYTYDPTRQQSPEPPPPRQHVQHP